MILHFTTFQCEYTQTIQCQTPCEAFGFAFSRPIEHSCSFPLPGWHVIMSEWCEGEKKKLLVGGQPSFSLQSRTISEERFHLQSYFVQHLNCDLDVDPLSIFSRVEDGGRH